MQNSAFRLALYFVLWPAGTVSKFLLVLSLNLFVRSDGTMAHAPEAGTGLTHCCLPRKGCKLVVPGGTLAPPTLCSMSLGTGTRMVGDKHPHDILRWPPTRLEFVGWPDRDYLLKEGKWYRKISLCINKTIVDSSETKTLCKKMKLFMLNDLAAHTISIFIIIRIMIYLKLLY